MFGTDEIGRDVLSRVIWGARASLLAGLVSVSIALSLGVPIGLLAGYVGGWTDGLISRITDAMLACPFLILAIALAAFLGPSLTNAMIAIGISATPIFIRLTRAQVLSVKVEDYVEAARAVGNSHLRIALRHILPNVVAPLIVQSTLAIAAAVIAEASLSFLGLGPAAAGAELGQHAQHREELRRQCAVDGDLARRCRSSCWCCRSTCWATACATRWIRGTSERRWRVWAAPPLRAMIEWPIQRRRLMKLKGSCHCGAVTFSVDSHTPQPYMRCYCSICRKTAGGGGYAINIMGATKTLKVRGAKNIAVYRARFKEAGAKKPTLSKARRHFCAKCASAFWVWDPRWAEWVYPFASAIDTPLTQAARRRIDHARLRGALVGRAEGSRPPAFSRVPERVDRRLAQKARTRSPVGELSHRHGETRANCAPGLSPAAHRRPNRFSSSSESASCCRPSARRSSARPAGTGERSAGNWETPASPRRAR